MAALRSRTAWGEGLEPGPELVVTGHAAEKGGAALVPAVPSVLSSVTVVEEIGGSVSDAAAAARSVSAVAVVTEKSVDLKVREAHVREERGPEGERGGC